MADERVLLVTGGAGAVASAVTRVFMGAGTRLALVDLEGSAVRERAAAAGTLAIIADLTSPEAASRMVVEAKQAFGRVDGLIHTAGGFAVASAVEEDVALYERMLDVNLRTLFNAVHAVLPELLAQGDGFIAAFSTNLVWTGSGGARMALYAAAKAAVTYYLRSLDRELAGSGVRVAIVYPLSSIDTPANRRNSPDTDPRTWVDPEEIARALLFASMRGPRGRVVELPISVAS